jgi:hypothetical protein
MSVSLTYDKQAWNKFIKRIEKNTSKKTQYAVLKKTAYQGMRKMILATPKDTGNTRRNWFVAAFAAGYKIFNSNPVASYLQYGTGLFGKRHKVITPKHKKFLYIPLRPGARIWRPGLTRGKDYILAKQSKGMKAQKYIDTPILWIAKQLVRNFLTILRKGGN